MSDTTSLSTANRRHEDALQELTRTQKIVLKRIEDDLIHRMKLTRSHLSGTDGCKPNFLLQQGVIHITRRHRKLRSSVDWLALYLNIRPGTVEDWDEAVKHALARSPKSEFSKSVLAVWNANSPGVDIATA